MNKAQAKKARKAAKDREAADAKAADLYGYMLGLNENDPQWLAHHLGRLVNRVARLEKEMMKLRRKSCSASL